jgi:hypothetical protein
MRRIGLAALLAVVVLQPLLYWRAFAGDAQVHLVFAENAAKGHLFEFNPGEAVSGETSPAYMLLGALAFLLMPAAWVPIALKVVGVLCWYVFAWLVYRSAVRFLAEAPARGWAIAAAAVSAAIPGSVYNATTGMESALFATMIWSFITLAARWRWLDERDQPVPREVAIASLLGLACWFRPEAFLVIVLMFGFRFFYAGGAPGGAVLGLCISCAIGLGSLALQYAYTGDLVATSVLSRRILGMPGTFRLGPFALSPAPALRLVAYFPLTALFMAGLQRSAGEVGRLERALQVLLVVVLVAYTLFGATHFARYIIFLVPVVAIGAARGARAVVRSRAVGKGIVAFGAVTLLAVCAAEIPLRMRRYYPLQLADTVAAPANRRRNTDELLARLGRPHKRPVSIALESVQVRYALDDRVVVRSLDGRVDRTLIHFATADAVDHVGYLRARNVDFLLDTPSYQRDQTRWSLARLRGLPPNQTTRNEIAFRRLGSQTAFALSP